MMRRTAVAAMCVLAPLVTPAQASAAHGRSAIPAKCALGHTHLLAVDTQAQVYKVIDYDGLLEAFGCVYGKRSYFLGRLPEKSLSPGGQGGVEHIALDGPFVAFQYSAYGAVGWASWVIVVQNLRTGKYVELPTGKLEEPNPNPESAGIGPALAIVVSSNGSVAWIAEDRLLSENKPTYYQVHAVDKTGSRILAAGTSIDPTSLALAGSTLYWTQGAQAFSAMLD